MAFTHYRTRGIFLKKEDRGEADQLLTIFTEDFGKLEILARGVRKITSKLRSGAELFCLSEVEFIQGKIYKTLTDAVLIDKFKGIKQEPEKFDTTCQMAEAIDILCPRQEKDINLWRLLIETFYCLENWKLEIKNSIEIKNYKLKIIYYFFLWNLFSILGYAPELYHCVACRKKLIPKKLYFCPEEGGVVCENCSNNNRYKTGRSSKSVTADVVKILRIFAQGDWDLVKKIKITKQDEEGLKEVSDFYLAFFKEQLCPSICCADRFWCRFLRF